MFNTLFKSNDKFWIARWENIKCDSFRTLNVTLIQRLSQMLVFEKD